MPGDRDEKTDTAGASKASGAPAAAGATEGPGEPTGGRDFIRHRVRADIESGRTSVVATRFPPEPNGYLHIGHAKSICLNFGLAGEFGGRCHLRFDDTNPVDGRAGVRRRHPGEDIRWLGFDWGEHLYFASDYFEKLYELRRRADPAGQGLRLRPLVGRDRARRGTLTEPGARVPYRTRSVEENLDLFERMRAGEFDDGDRVLRAKIDMASPVLTDARPHPLPDPWMPATTGPATSGAIYPIYDFAHCLSDAIEGITHSHLHARVRGPPPALRLDPRGRWTPERRPQQIEFARLNLTHTVMTQAQAAAARRERARRRLGRSAHADARGLAAARLPAASRSATFCEAIGVREASSTIELARLEASIRED